MSAIDVEGLRVTLGGRAVLDDVTFEVPWGSVTGFLGVNGAGKSTTIRAMLGLVVAEGRARIAGLVPTRMPNPARVVGVALDELRADPQHSPRVHLQQLAARCGVADARADAALEIVGLSTSTAAGARRGRRIGALSLGMRKRLAIAAALVGSPRVLVLDEPFDGLDPTGRRWLRALVRTHADRGGAVLLSSHGLDEIASVLDRVVVLDDGRVRLAGPTRSLLDAASSHVVVRSPDVAALLEVLVAMGAHVARDGRDGLLVTGATAEAVARVALEHRLLVVELATATPTLSDAFVATIART